MPNPFSTPAKQSTGAVVEYEPVLDSTLVCQFCFQDSTEGTYWPKARRLVWDCDHCHQTNVVRNIELD